MSEKTKEQLKKEIKDLKNENKRLESLLDFRYEEYLKQHKTINDKNKALDTILNNLDIYQFNHKYSIENSTYTNYIGVRFKLKNRVMYLNADDFSNLINRYHDIGKNKNLPHFVRSEIYSKI